MSATSMTRMLLPGFGQCAILRSQSRLLSTSIRLRAEKDGVHGSADTKNNNPRDGPMYDANGMRHKTDNEKQREEAVRGTPEADMSPAAAHAQANKNKEGGDMNKIQTGGPIDREAGKNVKQQKG